RTTLTAFAGSIGIIGIALIYAVSNGMTTYINTVQEETLSSYPLTLEAQHMDLGSMMQVFMESASASGNHDKDAVYQKGALYDLVNALNKMETKENDLKTFKKWIEQQWEKDTGKDGLHDAINGIQYTYNTDLLVYTLNTDGTVIRSDTQELMSDMLLKFFGAVMGTDREETESNFAGNMSMMNMMPSAGGMNLWQEILPGRNGEIINPVVQKQYDLIDGGRWPAAYNEIVLVVDENNEIDDMTLYALGLKSEEEMDAIIDAAVNGTELTAETKKWTYDEIKALTYKVVLGSQCYVYDAKTGLYNDIRETQAGLKYLYDNGVDLKVVGIVRPKEDAVASILTGSIAYSNLLTEYIIEEASKSDVVAAQKDSPTIDIFNGLPFDESTGNISAEEKLEYFKSYVAELSAEQKIATYIKMKSIPAAAEVEAYVAGVMQTMDRTKIEAMLTGVLTAQLGMSQEEVADYLANMSDEDLNSIFEQSVAAQYTEMYAKKTAEALAKVPAAQLMAMMEAEMAALSADQADIYYDNVLEFSKSSLKANLAELGCVDLESPATINLYATSFEQKDIIKAAIDNYNKTVDDVERIAYTDIVGIMMSSITTIINAITYVLIAFVAVSLVVSSIMIGVITLISVQERTKEIGILRAIGASKRNVSSMFNAETVIIGLASGLLGVGVTYLLCIPINIILHALTGIGNLSAILPLPVAALLVGISVLLTLFSGIIPSRSAAKKDPVVALRTE
ncbi:MAG: ABC transporter permease, partial [Clostridia bacterium]|nr:ABC transporter permease [Clostridia bacterium]